MILRSVSRGIRVGDPCPWAGAHGKGPRGCCPRGPCPSAPVSGRRRCRRMRRRGVRRGRRVCRSRRGGTRGRVAQSVGGFLASGDGAQLRSCFDRIAVGSERPRSRPLWGDRAAVPCRPVTCAGARSHDVPSVRHTPQRSHAWFSFQARPWLARTPVPTKPARPSVTRRTGESGPELRCARPPGRAVRPRAPVRRGLGTARAVSSPAPSPACRARPGSGRGPPSRATGSPVARPR